MGIEERAQEKKLEAKCRKVNATMDVKSYKAQRDKKRNQWDNERPGKNVEVVGHVVRRKEHYLRRRAVGMEVQGRRRRRSLGGGEEGL